MMRRLRLHAIRPLTRSFLAGRRAAVPPCSAAAKATTIVGLTAGGAVLTQQHNRLVRMDYDADLDMIRPFVDLAIMGILFYTIMNIPYPNSDMPSGLTLREEVEATQKLYRERCRKHYREPTQCEEIYVVLARVKECMTEGSVDTAKLPEVLLMMVDFDGSQSMSREEWIAFLMSFCMLEMLTPEHQRNLSAEGVMETLDKCEHSKEAFDEIKSLQEMSWWEIKSWWAENAYLIKLMQSIETNHCGKVDGDEFKRWCAGNLGPVGKQT